MKLATEDQGVRLRKRFDTLRLLTWLWFALVCFLILLFVVWYFVLRQYVTVAANYGSVWMFSIVIISIVPIALLQLFGIQCTRCKYRFRGWLLQVAVSGHLQYSVRFCPGCGQQFEPAKHKKWRWFGDD